MTIKINNHWYKTLVSINKFFSGTTLEGWLLTAQEYRDQEIVDSLLKAKFIKVIR